MDAEAAKSKLDRYVILPAALLASHRSGGDPGGGDLADETAGGRRGALPCRVVVAGGGASGGALLRALLSLPHAARARAAVRATAIVATQRWT